METIIVRRIESKEWSQHRAIRLRMLKEAPEAFGSTAAAESTISNDEWRASAESRSQGSDQAMFVAVAEASWIGCVIASRADGTVDVARVWAMWVEPEWRSRKIALLLLQKVSEWATSAGYRKLWLKVAEKNVPALRLYERFGFKATGERSAMRRDQSIWMLTMEMEL